MKLLTDHPASVGETYLEHMRLALKFAGSLALASGACAIHAFLPFLLKSSGSRRVTELHRQMVEKRNASAACGESDPGLVTDRL